MFEILNINLNNLNEKKLDLIVQSFKEGKVIAYPTDTIYGLGCLVNKKAAVKKIYNIKNRDLSKVFLLLVSSVAMAKKYCEINAKQEAYLKKHWPDKKTFILNSKKETEMEKISHTESLALRLPKNDFLIKIIKRLKEPIVSTSINLEGEKSLNQSQEIFPFFSNTAGPKPDLLIFKAKNNNTKSSSIIDIRDIRDIKILRK